MTSCLAVGGCVLAARDWVWNNSHAIWEFTTHPVLAILLAAIVAFHYQKRGKLWEFKFDTFKAAGPIYYGVVSAGRRYGEAQGLMAWTVNNAKPQDDIGDVMDGVRLAESNLQRCVLEAQGLIPIMTSLFHQDTHIHWRKMVGYYRDMLSGQDDPIHGLMDMKTATDEWGQFAEKAGREIHLPFVGAVVDAVTEEYRLKDEELHRSLSNFVEIANKRQSGQRDTREAGRTGQTPPE